MKKGGILLLMLLYSHFSIASLTLKAPKKVENGSVVPVTVEISPAMYQGDKLELLVGDNLAYIVEIEGPDSVSRVSARVRSDKSYGSIDVKLVRKSGEEEAEYAGFDNSKTSTPPNIGSKGKTVKQKFKSQLFGDSNLKILFKNDMGYDGHINKFDVTTSKGKIKISMTPWMSKHPFFGISGNFDDAKVKNINVSSIYDPKAKRKKSSKSASFSDLWKQNGGEFVDSISNVQPNKEIKAKTTYVDNSDFSIKINQKDNNQIETDRFLISGLIESVNQIKSILINGGELSFEESGKFSKELYISLGENRFVIEAIDIYGNKAIKNVAVNRVEREASNSDPQLVPPKSLVKSDENAIALIFGMEKYKSMPKANWADSDANIFYDFAIKTLGVKPENIERLINEESNYANIWKTIDNWLNSKVEKGKSKVYVYFAGHGLASEDGSKAYLLPYDADSAILRRTAIPRQEIIQAIEKLKPKKATFFMDTCYSGNAKGGAKLLVASRGLRIVKKNQFDSLPDNFTIFSAARNDETAISHPSQKNGLFSYWLMRGLSGDADLDSNKEITNTELFEFLSDKVSRTAIAKGQKQNPELFGERDEVISSWKSGFFN